MAKEKGPELLSKGNTLGQEGMPGEMLVEQLDLPLLPQGPLMVGSGSMRST